MKVSIAMATYNGAKYLKAQLQSLVDQTLQPDELIITDDCSTDETEAIVREFARKAPFKVEFFRNEKNMGYCGNFNAALMKTSGDLVFLCDQDDVWFPDKIEHMVGVAERNPEALVVMNDAALTDGRLNELGLTKVGQIRSAGFSMDSFVMGCCCAVRRELLDLCMPIRAGVKGHDNWLVQFADGLNAKLVDETVLQYYRRHESNVSQFIANRTTKVTRTQARLNAIKTVLNQNAVEQVRAGLQQLQIFADGVRDAEKKAPEHYKTELAALEKRYREHADTTEQRLVVVEKPFFARIVAASSLLMRGGYNSAKGVRWFIRDILG
ncbi:glycosyltransferase family 2 protein [Marinobacter sp. BSs20148]|uniref:glycosyltransferase family 2 protein n=1 Tax=Marinobacter sp. BSs20148 TaxID=490759 RepID=UPI000277712E|nr:glycosyltransferase family 2 protein [Marinobacter sp. BSs20148]AFP31446.1 amily 2 glycosyl transferase [Marinobacter sp. BSs20148]